MCSDRHVCMASCALPLDVPRTKSFLGDAAASIESAVAQGILREAAFWLVALCSERLCLLW